MRVRAHSGLNTYRPDSFLEQINVIVPSLNLSLHTLNVFIGEFEKSDLADTLVGIVIGYPGTLGQQSRGGTSGKRLACLGIQCFSVDRWE